MKPGTKPRKRATRPTKQDQRIADLRKQRAALEAEIRRITGEITELIIEAR